MIYLLMTAPHSLGKLFEWKLYLSESDNNCYLPPHSLGKLFEWKLISDSLPFWTTNELPTRWGNYLNGNKLRRILSALLPPNSPLAGEII